jgi:light-regulated signal transduction histidine kinase (bacteriophytochrome)
MSALIEDLLVFSRVTTHTRPFQRLDLTRVAEDVTQDLETVIAEAGATVRISPLPAIDADPLQMRQLLQNLVSNAIKFRSPDHAPTVTLAGTTLDGQAVLTIADDGIGFDEKYAERIFRVFERLHARDAYEGTGIGLALCRKIVERHDGSIRATSAPGAGTTFTIRLPVHHPEAAPARDGDDGGGGAGGPRRGELTHA